MLKLNIEIPLFQPKKKCWKGSLKGEDGWELSYEFRLHRDNDSDSKKKD